MRTEMAHPRLIAVRLLFICCLAASACQGQSQIRSALELPFPERMAEMKARVLALGESGAQEVIGDIKSEIKDGLDFARKSFLIDVVLDYEDPIAAVAVQDLLNRENNPNVVMLTIRSIKHRRESDYLDELAELLEDERVAITVTSSHGPDRPVTLRREVIEALSQITGATPTLASASEEEQAASWRQWLETRPDDPEMEKSVEKAQGDSHLEKR